MAGSPAYLQLLDAIEDEGPESTTWDNLEDAWASLTLIPDETSLVHLSWTAFNILARETGRPLFELMPEAKQLHIDKNAGYAGADNPDPWANFRLAASFGVTPFDGVLVRLSDKWSRIQSLRRNASNERIGESLLDTLRDLAAYALIAVCLLKEEELAA